MDKKVVDTKLVVTSVSATGADDSVTVQELENVLRKFYKDGWNLFKIQAMGFEPNKVNVFITLVKYEK